MSPVCVSRTPECTFLRGVENCTLLVPSPRTRPCCPCLSSHLLRPSGQVCGASALAEHPPRNGASACVLHVMTMVNPKPQGCSGNLLVKLLYVLFSVTYSNSSQAVRCWWVILGWKRFHLWALPDKAQLMDEPLLCLWAALFRLIPRFPTWVCAVPAGIAGNAAPKLWNLWKTKALFVLLISGLCCHSGFSLTDRRKIKANLQKSRNGIFRLMKLYCVWQMGG